MADKVLTAEETNLPMPRKNKRGKESPSLKFKEEFNYGSY